MRHEALLGRKVAGRFTITRFLGEGGMASVFVAERDAEPRRVAIKIMNPELTADRAFVRRFQREAKAAARVKHPNSVKIYEYGVEGPLSYIVMELLAGDDLYVLLERHGAIGQARAVRILAEVCDALAVAHEMGVVHRDLKPENIMVIRDPTHPHGERVKVLDFGIAKILDVESSRDPTDVPLDPMSVVTRAGTFIGTPAYMSPEQCGLLPVDPRADLYTCGVLLFQLVTGRLPFEGETPLHTATLHIHAPVPAPSVCAPGIDPRLEALLLKALSKQPADRYQTARELGAALRGLLADLPDTAVGLGPISARQPNSIFPREVLPGGAPRLPLERAPTAPSGLALVGDGAGESVRTLVSGSPGPDAGPPPPAPRISPPPELPPTLDGPDIGRGAGAEPQRWAGDSVPEISLQLPSWTHAPSEALLSGNGLSTSSASDEPGEDDSTLTMVRQDELRAPPKVRVHAPPPDEGGETNLTPPGREVKSTLRSAEDFGLGTPAKRAEIGLVRVDVAPAVPPVRVDSAPAIPPVTPQSPVFDAAAAAPHRRRSAETLRVASPYGPAYGPVDSSSPTVQPGELQAIIPQAAGAVNAASAVGAGGAVQVGPVAAAGAAAVAPAAAATAAAAPAAAVPLAFASTLASPGPMGRAAMPSQVAAAAPVAPAVPVAPQAPAAPSEPAWLAGKRGLLIGFVAGMILTAAAMFLVMRVL